MCLPEKLKDEKEWNDAYNILVTLSDKFEKKYSDMIKNLVYLDIRKTLRIYKRILADSFGFAKRQMLIRRRKSIYLIILLSSGHWHVDQIWFI